MQLGVVALATVILALGFGIVLLASPRAPRTKVSEAAGPPVDAAATTTTAGSVPTTVVPAPTTTESPRKSLTDLAAAVVQIRRQSSAGQPCGDSTGVLVTTDGLILTSQRDVVATPDCETPDLLIALSSGIDAAPFVRYRGHVAADNASLDLAVVQIDRDSQGRRIPPPTLRAVEFSHTSSPPKTVPVRTLAFSESEAAPLSVLAGTASAPTTQPDAGSWLNLTSPVPPGGAGAAVFDISGRLVGIVTHAGWSDVLSQARPVAAAAGILQRVGVDVAPLSAAPVPPTTATTPTPPMSSVAVGPVKVSDIQLTGGKVGTTATPLPPVKSLPTGALSACIFWTIEGMRTGTRHGGSWSVNGLPAMTADDLVWNQSLMERTNWCWPPGRGPLPNGRHTFRYSVDGKELFEYSFTVG